MKKRYRRKHNAHKRVQVVCVEHRPFFGTTEGATTTVDKLDHSVADVATRLAEQASCYNERQAASDRCGAGRRTLNDALRHVATVSTLVARKDASAQVLDVRPFTSDEDLLAQADAIHTTASAHAELYVKQGVHPGLLDALASEVDAFRKAKAALTLARQRHTLATAAIDQGLKDGDEAVAVLEGILATAKDAPVGALAALRQAKRIGPRLEEDDQPAASTAEPTPAAAAPPVPNTVTQ